MLATQRFVMLRDIKDQLTRVHRVCRCKGKEHPKCKEEFQILDAYIEQYSDQLTNLKRIIQDDKSS